MRLLCIISCVLLCLSAEASGFRVVQEFPKKGFAGDTIPERLKQDSALLDTLTISETTVSNHFIKNYLKTASKGRRTEAFYDTLRALMAQKSLTAHLSRLLFNQTSGAKSQKFTKSEKEFNEFKGKIIRDIYLRKLNVFDSQSQEDGSEFVNWFIEAGNTMHVNTRDFVIRNNLLFEKGDRIKPFQMADNERILRQLDFIDKADIEVVPDFNSDSADIFVITQDIWSIGVGVRPHSFERVEGEIYDLNLAGLGREFTNRIDANFGDKHPYAYTAVYKADNLGGSFMQGKGRYHTSYPYKAKEVEFSRKPLLQNLNYFGGVQYGDYMQRKKFLREGAYDTIKFKYRLFDTWMGRNFILGPNNRTSLLISSGVNFYNYGSRNFYLKDYQRYQDRALYLLSTSLSRIRYFSTTNVFGYSKTEDIPYGYFLRLTGGYEDRRSENRHYMGFNTIYSNTTPNEGFAFGGINAGGFLTDKRIEDGVLRMSGAYLSPLIDFAHGKLRQYAAFQSTIGINRSPLDSIHINQKSGIRDFNSRYTYGKSRVVLQMESVWFTPWIFYGFEFALFGFMDVGIISPNNNFRNGSMFSGIGLGLRMGNEHLAIKNIEFRLGFYPFSPVDENPLQFTVDTYQSKFNAENYCLKPGTVTYE